jgi:hypothetical protein
MSPDDGLFLNNKETQNITTYVFPPLISLVVFFSFVVKKSTTEETKFTKKLLAAVPRFKAPA